MSTSFEILITYNLKLLNIQGNADHKKHYIFYNINMCHDIFYFVHYDFEYISVKFNNVTIV